MILNKVNKTIGLLRKYQNIVPRSALLTIYKRFIRPHLDYSDIIYDQAYSASFNQKLEPLQYNTCLAITRANRGTTKEKTVWRTMFGVLSTTSLVPKISWFYKLFNKEYLHYLFKLILSRRSGYVARNMQNIPLFKTRHTFLKNSFFSSTLNGINLIII